MRLVIIDDDENQEHDLEIDLLEYGFDAREIEVFERLRRHFEGLLEQIELA